MAAQCPIYLTLTLITEKLVSIPSFVALFSRAPRVNIPEERMDEDVEAEKRRIQAGQADRDIVVLKGLQKIYPGKIAVRDLYFALPAGECFGFLGVNGAGKTTTLRMLTGDEIATEGKAYLQGHDLSTEPATVRRLMGYCPQFDALHANLTAKETLTFYGRIRGIPEEHLPKMVSYLIERLSLGDYADREAGKYSGGNKRKLSVAIALIGNPPIVFLDEPSTGIDPVSRRFMWDFISETMTKRCVILTTHSMEECEALCTRLGIISSGQLRCLGTAQHLKNRFGRGLQIDISTGSQDVTKAREFMKSSFGGLEELESYGGHLRYKLESKSTLAEVFTLIEQNKERVGISDYSVGQTTLEQIFVNFAKEADQQSQSSENGRNGRSEGKVES